jgi:hypothetical protein
MPPAKRPEENLQAVVGKTKNILGDTTKILTKKTRGDITGCGITIFCFKFFLFSIIFILLF